MALDSRMSSLFELSFVPFNIVRYILCNMLCLAANSERNAAECGSKYCCSDTREDK